MQELTSAPPSYARLKLLHAILQRLFDDLEKGIVVERAPVARGSC